MKKTIRVRREPKCCVICGKPTKTKIILDTDRQDIKNVSFNICYDCLQKMMQNAKETK